MKQEEKLKLAGAMIRCHCKKKHRQKTLCTSCTELLDYVSNRLKNCHLPAESSTCFMCPEYCYDADMRGKIRAVMRSSASYMLAKNPVLMVKHLLHLKKLHRHL